MIIVGRYVNGISLNGLEYLLDDDGKEKQFRNKELAKEYLLSTDYDGFTDEELEDSFVFEETNKF